MSDDHPLKTLAPGDEPPKMFLTPNELAAYWCMASHTLANWRHQGIGPSSIVGVCIIYAVDDDACQKNHKGRTSHDHHDSDQEPGPRPRAEVFRFRQLRLQAGHGCATAGGHKRTAPIRIQKLGGLRLSYGASKRSAAANKFHKGDTIDARGEAHREIFPRRDGSQGEKLVIKYGLVDLIKAA